ncbi:MAG TPA: hypothetical protein VGG06_18950 [Thermoanaerobaculia bacterium]|jgi:hypothetical protein
MSEKRFPGCFKFGCFGCLALFALAVGLLVLIGVVQATMEDQEPDPEQSQASHPLPPPPVRPPQPDQVEMPEIAPLPPGVEAPPAAAAGTVVLDLRMGEFTIRPGPPGEPIRIEADYDANVFNLTESFNESEDGTWTYDVSFGARGGWLGLLFRGGGSSNRNQVDVIIPRGHPVSIVGKIGMGESEIDLGGLWVENVDLEMSAGDHFLEFREPTPVPMEDFRLDGSMGNLEVRGLGEASPRTVTVDHGMGELLVDLAGPWRRDATVDVGFSMGECRLWLPKTARVEISRASVGMGEKYVDHHDESGLPADAPLLTLNVRGSMGELRVEN